jgi:hypothetical protein
LSSPKYPAQANPLSTAPALFSFATPHGPSFFVDNARSLENGNLPRGPLFSTALTTNHPKYASRELLPRVLFSSNPPPQKAQVTNQTKNITIGSKQKQRAAQRRRDNLETDSRLQRQGARAFERWQDPKGSTQ